MISQAKNSIQTLGATSWERSASTSWSNICMDLGIIYSKRLNSDASIQEGFYGSIC